jgi:SAM-dependent methyltransferase
MNEELRQRTEDPTTSRDCGPTVWPAKAASGLPSDWKREALASGLDGRRPRSGPGGITQPEDQQLEAYFRQYTSHLEILKYTKATAGVGINYLLEHDYKAVYLNALNFLPRQTRERGIRILEFGCGGGMNLLHLISMLNSEGTRVANAVGTDFSPAMIETARLEATNHLREQDLQNLEFHVAKNESLISDLSVSMTREESTLKNSFHFILGVNTIRYCHDAKRQRDCARDIFNLLVPGGVCVVIDMNNRFPLFRSDLKNRFRRQKEKQCYVPSLEEYTEPFVQEGFEVLRSEHFCWVPHSAGGLMTSLLSRMSPILNKVARSHAMRSLVVSLKPTTVT